MLDPLKLAMRTAASGLEAQSRRLNIVSQNLANSESTGASPGADPYRRKTISFQAVLDRQSGANIVAIDRIGLDPSSFRVEHLPGHPAADEGGYVKLPNVNVLIEMADMREANRSYQANLQVIKQAGEIISMTIDLMRSG